MAQAHSARAHAKLAPSAAHRWVECPGSVRLTAGIESKSSSYAAEGTAAHEISSLCLQTGKTPEKFLGCVIDTQPATQRDFFTSAEADNLTTFEVTEEMVEAVQTYVDTVRSLCVGEFELDVEQRLDMTHIHPEIFGTGDAVIYLPATGWLHVLDFKYGKGVVVSPEDNPQLMLYGAGAARRHHNRVLNGLTLHIVQPRAAGVAVKPWETDPFSLMEFEDVLGRAALDTERDDAELRAGEWCRFCQALPTCPAARARSLEAAVADFADGTEDPVEPGKLTADQLAAVLREAEFIGNWVKAVQAHAHAEAIAGRIPTGFKLVPKRATRKWKDTTDLADTLMVEYGVATDEIYTEPEVRSPAQLEQTIGKKAFAVFSEALVNKVSSGSNLVPESDPRPSVKADAQKEFAE